MSYAFAEEFPAKKCLPIKTCQDVAADDHGKGVSPKGSQRGVVVGGVA